MNAFLNWESCVQAGSFTFYQTFPVNHRSHCDVESFLFSFPQCPRLISSLQVVQLCISRNISGFYYTTITVPHFCIFLVKSNQWKSLLFFPMRSFLCDCCWMWSVLDNSRRPLKQSRPEPQQRLALTGKKIKELLKLVHVTRSSLYIKSFEAGMPLSSKK